VVGTVRDCSDWSFELAAKKKSDLSFILSVIVSKLYFSHKATTISHDFKSRYIPYHLSMCYSRYEVSTLKRDDKLEAHRFCTSYPTVSPTQPCCSSALRYYTCSVYALKQTPPPLHPLPTPRSSLLTSIYPHTLNHPSRIITLKSPPLHIESAQTTRMKIPKKPPRIPPSESKSPALALA
jgi:hypothetical protein